tara:strand:+ start:16940 stop:17404 length:465 start_codon:yes stop_codon:yes gene_type:complete
MSKDQKSFTAFLKKRAPIYLGLIGIFFLFAYPALIEKNLESHIPTDLSEDQQAIVDSILSYNGLNNSGMTIMNVLEEEISTKFVNEKIFDTEITLLKLEFQKLSDSDSSHEVTFLFMINEDILTYTWIVNMNSDEILSGNQEAKRILDIVNYYD